jgi:hypothetical protein
VHTRRRTTDESSDSPRPNHVGLIEPSAGSVRVVSDALAVLIPVNRLDTTGRERAGSVWASGVSEP